MITLEERTVLAIAPRHNTKKADATGAFHIEGKALLTLAQDGELVLIDNHKSPKAQRTAVLDALANVSGTLGSVAFLCHGWSSGIQLGFGRAHVQDLADALVAASADPSELVVPLYCCSTGADPKDDSATAPGTGEGGFADRLRDALCIAGATGCRVMAHTTKGHTTKNPRVLFMDGMNVPDGGVGGYAPVAPKSSRWKPWAASLRDDHGTLRLRMPYMDVASIHAELD